MKTLPRGSLVELFAQLLRREVRNQLLHLNLLQLGAALQHQRTGLFPIVLPRRDRRLCLVCKPTRCGSHPIVCVCVCVCVWAVCTAWQLVATNACVMSSQHDVTHTSFFSVVDVAPEYFALFLSISLPLNSYGLSPSLHTHTHTHLHAQVRFQHGAYLILLGDLRNLCSGASFVRCEQRAR
jgi:hypothetical protein